MCSPKDFGSLGLPNLDMFSRALRLRWLWFEWRAPDRPWVGMPPPCDRTDRDLFAAATRIQIGDGGRASFWESTWLGDAPLSQLFPSLHAQSRRKSRTVVDALRDHQWVRDLRPDMPPPALAQFLQAWALLLDANTQLHPGTTDSITWTLTADGNYSAKSAYLVQFAGRQYAPMTVAIWDTWMPPKIRIFSWLLHQNRLWCADRLQRRGWANEYFCPLCVRNLETATHLFFECHFACRIWSLLSAWPRCLSMSHAAGAASSSEAWDQVMAHSTGDVRRGISSLFALTCWSIWRERNERIFRHKRATPQIIASWIEDEAQGWAFAGAKALRKLMWEPP